MESKLLGADGKPLQRAVTDYVEGPIRDRGRFIEIDKEALEQIKRQRARKLAMTTVPSTPRSMVRDHGGVAVGRGYGRWPHITNDMLRDLRERAPVLQPIHQARQYQVRHMARKWSGQKGHVGFRVVHKLHQEQDAKPPEGFDRWIKRFEELLWSPAPDYDVHTLGDALCLLEEDLLTINRPVVELVPSMVNPRRILQWRPVDGGIIWPTLLWVEKWKTDNPRWSVGYDKGRLREEDVIDIVSHKADMDLRLAKHVLVREGIAEAVYPDGRLIVAPYQNRTDIRFVGYPPSHVEQSVALVSAFMHAFDYNASYFTKGMLAEFILGLPATMHDEDVDAFIDMFREVSQGTDRAWQPPILPLPPGGKDAFQKIDLKQSNREMMYEVFISLTMSLAAAVYRMDMSPINAKPWDGGSGPKLGEASRSEEIALAKEEGLQGDLEHLNSHVLTPMARRVHPDLMVLTEYGDYDPEKEARVYEIRGRTDMSRNEIRLEQGKRPRGYWLKEEEYDSLDPDDEKRQKHDDNPWNWPTDPTFASAINSAKQLQQQKEMADQMQQQGGDPSQGADDGFGGQDDGYGGAHPANGPQFPYGQPGQQGGPPGQQGGPPGAPPGAPSPMAKAARHVHIHVHRDDGGESYE